MKSNKRIFINFLFNKNRTLSFINNIIGFFFQIIINSILNTIAVCSYVINIFPEIIKCSIGLFKKLLIDFFDLIIFFKQKIIEAIKIFSRKISVLIKLFVQSTIKFIETAKSITRDTVKQTVIFFQRLFKLIKKIISGVVSAIKLLITLTLRTIVNVIKSFLDFVKFFIPNLFILAENIFLVIATLIKIVVVKYIDAIKQLITSIVKLVKTIVIKFIDVIKFLIKSITNIVIRIIKSIIKTAGDFVRLAVSILKKISRNFININKDFFYKLYTLLKSFFILIDKKISAAIDLYKRKVKIKPVFFFTFLFIIFIQKIFFLIFNLVNRNLEFSLIFISPLILAQDIIIALIIFLIFDVAIFFIIKIQNRIFNLIMKSLVNFLFFIVTFYSFCILKFYALFGTYLTYGLILQADNIGSFKEGIAQEVDLFFIFIILISFVFFSIVIYIQNHFYKKQKNSVIFNAIGNNIAAHVILVKTLIYIVVIFFITILIYTSPKFLFENYNLYSTDRNPIAEVVVSSFIGVYNKIALKDKDEMESVQVMPLANLMPQNLKLLLQRKLSRFSSDSLMSPGEIVEGIKLLKNDKELLDNLNIVVYLFESTSGNYIGSQNEKFKPYTKNIDRIASNSLYLTNHYSQEPASLKSLYTILTGKYSYKTRNWKQFVKRAEADISFPEILKQHGYSTIYLTSLNGRIYYQNSFLKNRFDTVIDKSKIKVQLMNENIKFKEYALNYDDRVLIKLFDDYLKKQKGKFMAFISPIFPHHPYNTPSEEFVITDNVRNFDRYKNSLYFSDYVLGEIHGLLKKHNILNNTLFIILADHGEAFLQHSGNFLHSIYIYEENVKTFCIISNPVLFKGQVYKEKTRHIDIAPTILDLLSLDISNFDGESFLKPHLKQFAFFYTHWGTPYLGMTDNNWKYIYNGRYGSEELYDLSIDSNEKVNLASKNPEICSIFKKKMLLLEDYIK